MNDVNVCCNTEGEESYALLKNDTKCAKSILLRASCLKLEINEFGCYEAKIEESEKGQQPPGVQPRTPLA